MDNIKTILLATSLIANFGAASAQENKQLSGKASYYSNGLHGRRMSNGERYDRNGYTCAHKTLPFGTRLRVTNPRNNHSVEVRVTDRGPFVKGRILDLSYSAARDLGILASGVAYIKVEILPKNKPTEIPFPAEPTTLELPETEYGVAGVCYEFIPEWEKPDQLAVPQTITRKSSTRQRSTSASAKQSTLQKPAPQSQKGANPTPAKQPTSAPHKSTPQSQKPANPTPVKQSIPAPPKPAAPPKEKSSSIWDNFFNRVKEGVTGFF